VPRSTHRASRPASAQEAPRGRPSLHHPPGRRPLGGASIHPAGTRPPIGPTVRQIAHRQRRCRPPPMGRPGGRPTWPRPTVPLCRTVLARGARPERDVAPPTSRRRTQPKRIAHGSRRSRRARPVDGNDLLPRPIITLRQGDPAVRDVRRGPPHGRRPRSSQPFADSGRTTSPPPPTCAQLGTRSMDRIGGRRDRRRSETSRSAGHDDGRVRRLPRPDRGAARRRRGGRRCGCPGSLHDQSDPQRRVTAPRIVGSGDVSWSAA